VSPPGFFVGENTLRNPAPDLGPTLSPEELDQAHVVWIRRVQNGAFRPEIGAAGAGRPASSRSPLRRLSPRLDKQGLLRVGGRLKHAVISEDQRHPIILPHTSHVTHLVVSAEHLRTFHGGIQLTLAALRRRYWMLRGRQVVRRHIHRCVTCVRWRAEFPQPRMGSLPRARVTPSRAFTHTGVDFAGPIRTRCAPPRAVGIEHTRSL